MVIFWAMGCAKIDLRRLDMDVLFYEVLEYIILQQKVSLAGIQRRFKIGFSRMINLIEQYEHFGYLESEGNSYAICITLATLNGLKAVN